MSESEARFKRGDQVWVALSGRVVNSTHNGDGYRVETKDGWYAVVPAWSVHNMGEDA